MHFELTMLILGTWLLVSIILLFDIDYFISRSLVLLNFLLLFFCILFFSWSWNEVKFDYKDQEYLVSKVDGVDVAIIDGEPVNLNERFNRSFEDGETIVVRHFESAWKNGFYFERSDYKLITARLEVEREGFEPS